MIASRVSQSQKYFEFNFPQDKTREKNKEYISQRFRLMMLNNNLTLLKYLRRRVGFYCVQLFELEEEYDTDFWAFIHDKEKNRIYLISFYIQATVESFERENGMKFNLNAVYDNNGRIKGYEVLDKCETIKITSSDSQMREKSTKDTINLKSDKSHFFEKKISKNSQENISQLKTSSRVSNEGKQKNLMSKKKGFMNSINLSTKKYGTNKTMQYKQNQIEADYVILNKLIETNQGFKRVNKGYRFFRTGSGKILKKKRNRKYNKDKKCIQRSGEYWRRVNEIRASKNQNKNFNFGGYYKVGTTPTPLLIRRNNLERSKGSFADEVRQLLEMKNKGMEETERDVMLGKREFPENDDKQNE